MKPHLLLTSLLLLLTTLTRTSAQDLPGKRDSLFSEVLKEKRFVQVVLPENYQPDSKEKYDVIYVLDGESNTKIVSPIQRFLQNEKFMPSAIVVGLFNVDRNRDFLPTKVAQFSTAGGADNFLSFFKTELMPYINKTYPVNGNNILFGASFGGVFSTYACLTEPNLFNCYIASDPSYWWDNGYMNKLATEKLPSLKGLNKSLYITGREGEALKGMKIDVMDSILKTKAPDGFLWKSVAYADETHGSVNLKSIYDGLKFSYSGYNSQNIEFHPMNGIVLKGKPVKVWCFSDLKGIKYTTNGTEPTLSSSAMGREIQLEGPAELKLKLFSNSGKYDKVVSGSFKEGKVVPSIKQPKNSTAGGLKYTYYEGTWDKLPDFSKLKNGRTGRTDKDFNFSKLPSKINFACVFEGFVEIKEEGYYIFGINSDDGSKLYLANKLLINNDGTHGMAAKSFILPLEKGFYPIKVEYFQKDGPADLQLVYLTPGAIEPKLVPFEFQYSN